MAAPMFDAYSPLPPTAAYAATPTAVHYRPETTSPDMLMAGVTALAIVAALLVRHRVRSRP